MTNKDKSINKDKIITLLNNSSDKEFSINDISMSINLDFDTTLYLCNEIIASQQVYSRNISSKSGSDKLIKINPSGIYFLQNEGGYVDKHIKEIKSEHDEVELKRLNRTKLKSEILRNRIFNVITIPSTIYALCDIIGKLVQPEFDLLEYLALWIEKIT